jgi:hypothetical protein
MFKSKVISKDIVEKMYKSGIEETNENNIQNKLLEIGIMTDVEWIKDFNFENDVSTENIES